MQVLRTKRYPSKRLKQRVHQIVSGINDFPDFYPFSSSPSFNTHVLC